MPRQAVDEIKVNARESRSARSFNGGTGLFDCLMAPDRFLNDIVHVLNTERNAIEPQCAQMAQILGRGYTRVRLDRHFSVGR